jgi:hypothetical protein
MRRDSRRRDFRQLAWVIVQRGSCQENSEFPNMRSHSITDDSEFPKQRSPRALENSEFQNTRSKRNLLDSNMGKLTAKAWVLRLADTNIAGPSFAGELRV